MLKKLLLPALAGNVLEWYDFVLFGSFMNNFAKLFFYSRDSLNSLFFAYSLFAVSYLMRPIGAIIFGFIGDKYGRKICLYYSISIMCSTSFLISILPTYQFIGVSASIIFIIIRMLQGIALGGEYSGIVTYLVESSPLDRRTFFSSFALVGAYSGFLVSSLILFVLSLVFSQNELNEYGWRFGFAFGGGIGLFAYYIRTTFTETQEFKYRVIESRLEVNPLRELFITHRRQLFTASAVAILPAGFSYMFLVYFNSHLELYGNFQLNWLAKISLVTTAWMVLAIPLIGYLADAIFTRRIFMWASATLTIIFAIPLMQSLLIAPLTVILICATINVMFEANLLAEIAENFNVTCRYSGIAITLNLTNGVAGGIAPMIALLLINRNILFSPMFYIMVLSVISMIGLVIMGRHKMNVVASDVN